MGVIGSIALAIGLALLVYKLTYIDDSLRHRRMWEEMRLLANVTQRRNANTARSMHLQALDEAEAISPNNIMTAISLTELAELDYRAKHYSDAISKLQKARMIEKALLQTNAAGVDPRLLRGDELKITLLLSHCYEADGKLEAAKGENISALKAGAIALRDRPLDLLVMERFTESCARSCAMAKDFDEIKAVLGYLSPEVLAVVTRGYQGDIKRALEDARIRLDLQGPQADELDSFLQTRLTVKD